MQVPFVSVEVMTGHVEVRVFAMSSEGLAAVLHIPLLVYDLYASLFRFNRYLRSSCSGGNGAMADEGLAAVLNPSELFLSKRSSAPETSSVLIEALLCRVQVGVFAMGDEGLAAVLNPSELFLSERSSAPETSSAVTVTLEGSRPLLLEVQALCSPTHQVNLSKLSDI